MSVKAFKAGFIVIVSDADPNKDRVLIKTPKFELTTVLAELMNLVGQGLDR